MNVRACKLPNGGLAFWLIAWCLWHVLSSAASTHVKASGAKLWRA